MEIQGFHAVPYMNNYLAILMSSVDAIYSPVLVKSMRDFPLTSQEEWPKVQIRAVQNQ